MIVEEEKWRWPLGMTVTEGDLYPSPSYSFAGRLRRLVGEQMPLSDARTQTVDAAITHTHSLLLFVSEESSPRNP